MSIEEIKEKLIKDFRGQVYVGKNYTVADLIKDLDEVGRFIDNYCEGCRGNSFLE